MPVVDMSHIGRGFPDILAMNSDGFAVPIEIKNPRTEYGRKGLTPLQADFHRTFRCARIVQTVQEAFHVLGLLR